MGAYASLSIFSFLIVVLAVVTYYYYSSLAKGKAQMQALHFLARPHITTGDDYIFKEVQLPTAWNGSYMSTHPELWMDILNDEEQHAFTLAIQHFQKLNKTMEQMTISEGDFPLPPALQQKILHWKSHLSPHGYGFYALRGVPVDKWSFHQSEIFFFALGKYLGTPGAQDINGTLLGHVKSIGYVDDQERPYRQTVDIAYHVDASDVVGLLCLYPAKEGGISRIISSVSVFNRLLRFPKGQQYAAKLTNEIFSAMRPTFGLGLKVLPFTPLKIDQKGILRTFWNQEYYLKAYKLPNGTVTEMGKKDPLALEAIQAYESILVQDMRHGYVRRGNCSDIDDDPANDCLVIDANTPEELGLDMILERGDVQLVSNHFILHARTEFIDYTDKEIEEAPKTTNIEGEVVSSFGRRELFRLWLSQPGDLSWRQYISKQVDLLNVISSFVRGSVLYR